MRRLALVALCLAASVQSVARAADLPRPSAWTIAVDRAGPVVVSLDSSAIAAGVASALELRDPSGALIEAAVSPAPEGQVEARLVSLDETSSGWRLLFDLGPIPFHHDRLDVAAAELGRAAGCVLEASDDGQYFRALERGDLFWVGRDRSLQRGSLEYPAASERFLALQWPRAAGLPRFDAVHVRALPKGGHEPLAIELPPHPSSDSRWNEPRWFDLPAGTTPIESLRWEFASPTGPATTLVLGSNAGRWVALGSVQDARFVLSSALDGNTAVRIETRTGSGATPTPARVEGLTPKRWLVFDASTVGAYLLHAGGHAPDDKIAQPLGVVALTANLSLPRRAHASAVPLDPLQPRHSDGSPRARRFALTLPSSAEGPVRVPLSEALLDLIGNDTHSLRLMTGTAVIPFLREANGVPTLALVRQGPDILDITLPPSGGLITQLELCGIDPGPGGLNLTLALGGERAMRWTETLERRDARAAGPTNQFVNLRPVADQRRLTLSGLDASMLTHAMLRLWREEEAWLFVRPAGTVDLVDGFTPDPVPFPELEPYRAALAREASLLPVQLDKARVPSADSRWSRPLLIAAELLAAAILLFVLWRATRRSTHNPRAGVS